MLNVVIIGYVWPEPNSSAAGQNMLSIIKQNRQAGNKVTFLTAATDSVHKADLAALGVNSEAIALNCSSFNTRISELKPDVVIFDRYMTEEQFSWRIKEMCPNALRILNTEDLHSLRQARHDAVKNTGNAANANLNTELAQREVAAILRSDLTLIISEFEKNLLENHYRVPSKQLRLHPLIVENYDEQPAGFASRQHFVHIGNFRHAPNWDAVLQLKQHIWPAIRKKLPRAELHIYGAYLPKKASQLHNPSQGFLVKGWAESADEVMSSAKILLAPIRFGAGIKGKLLDAMKAGTPSITTWVGAEGILDTESTIGTKNLKDKNTPTWPGALCLPIVSATSTHADKGETINGKIKSNVQSTIDDIAHKATLLYQDEKAWQVESQKAQALLKHYITKTPTITLPSQIACLCKELENHRKSLFLQGLMWHQSLNATKYMSQWIEEKNKQTNK